MRQYDQILIVDEHKDDVDDFRSFFRFREFPNIRTATSGREATVILSVGSAVISLIVIDIGAADTEIRSLLNYVRTSKFAGQVVLCAKRRAMTAENAAHLAKAHGLQQATFIQKPPTKSDLERVFGPFLNFNGLLLSA